jgi:hypothetical protein
VGRSLAEVTSNPTTNGNRTPRRDRRLLFIKVPDAKVAKNRFHLDLRPGDRDAEVARLEALGAKRINIGQDPDAVTWVVMSDPFGNEFCILRALTAEEIAEGKT